MQGLSREGMPEAASGSQHLQSYVCPWETETRVNSLRSGESSCLGKKAPTGHRQSSGGKSRISCQNSFCRKENEDRLCSRGKAQGGKEVLSQEAGNSRATCVWGRAPVRRKREVSPKHRCAPAGIKAREALGNTPGLCCHGPSERHPCATVSLPPVGSPSPPGRPALPASVCRRVKAAAAPGTVRCRHINPPHKLPSVTLSNGHDRIVTPEV